MFLNHMAGSQKTADYTGRYFLIGDHRCFAIMPKVLVNPIRA